MTNCTVVTSMSKDYYEKVGRVFVETFKWYWPDDVELLIYTESKNLHIPVNLATVRSLHELKGYKEFIQTAKSWESEKDPTDYRFQASRFCNKVFAIHDAFFRTFEDVTYWFDADVEFTKSVTNKELVQLEPDGQFFYSYLGRQGYHTEGGFYGLAWSAGELVNRWLDLYLTNKVFYLPEWHDCVTFDQARAELSMYGKNLSKGLRIKHVWPETVLGTFSTHHKGPGRKEERFGDSASNAVFRGET